ncbi:hypothetical protein Bca101_058108 [Brassica carinata]
MEVSLHLFQLWRSNIRHLQRRPSLSALQICFSTSSLQIDLPSVPPHLTFAEPACQHSNLRYHNVNATYAPKSEHKLCHLKSPPERNLEPSPLLCMVPSSPLIGKCTFPSAGTTLVAARCLDKAFVVDLVGIGP